MRSDELKKRYKKKIQTIAEELAQEIINVEIGARKSKLRIGILRHKDHIAVC